ARPARDHVATEHGRDRPPAGVPVASRGVARALAGAGLPAGLPRPHGGGTSHDARLSPVRPAAPALPHPRAPLVAGIPDRRRSAIERVPRAGDVQRYLPDGVAVLPVGAVRVV